MNEQEVAELRRQLKRDRNNITKVYGCYVNENRSIVSTFSQSLALATDEEADAYLNLLKKSLSGTLGKNLIDIAFSNQQVIGSEEHGLLMKLRETKLEDEELLQKFYDKVISCVSLEENYLILIACNAYDVPYKAKDDTELSDGSEEMFTHLLCSIAPVKKSKPGLGYDYNEQHFHTFAGDWLVAPPQIGFLFPAFDDRSTNIYNALCYTKKPDDTVLPFIETVFCTDVPKPASEQKTCFETLLSNSLEEECSMEVVQAVHEQLTNLIDMHKENKITEPLQIHADTVTAVLEDCGVSAPRTEAFRERFDAEFGEDEAVSPKNIIDDKHFDVTLPEVTIRVKPQARDLVQTKTIDGIKYILIRAEDSVEVNGVSIHFDDETQQHTEA